MRIRDLRESHGYTQEYVAEYINVSRLTYIRYETNTRPIKAPELVKLAELYNVSVDYLLGISDVTMLDTNKDPPPEDRERAAAVAGAARSAQQLSAEMPRDVEALSRLIESIVDRALDKRTPPSGGQS